MKVIMCEVFSRVCGFLRPVDVYDPNTGFRTGGWNHGKKEEFRQRKPYSTTVSLSSTAPALHDEREMRERLVLEGVIRA